MIIFIDVNVWEFRYFYSFVLHQLNRGIEVDYTGDIFDIDKIPWFPQGLWKTIFHAAEATWEEKKKESSRVLTIDLEKQISTIISFNKIK